MRELDFNHPMQRTGKFTSITLKIYRYHHGRRHQSYRSAFLFLNSDRCRAKNGKASVEPSPPASCARWKGAHAGMLTFWKGKTKTRKNRHHVRIGKV
jgi:hypothetical protein